MFCENLIQTPKYLHICAYECCTWLALMAQHNIAENVYIYMNPADNINYIKLHSEGRIS